MTLVGAVTDISRKVILVVPIVIADVLVFTKSFLAFVPPSFATTAHLQSSSPICPPDARIGHPADRTCQIPFSFWSDCAVKSTRSPVARVMLSRVDALFIAESVSAVVLVALTLLSVWRERPD